MKIFNPIWMIKSQLHVDSLESFTDCFHKVRFMWVSNFHPIDNLAEVMITFFLKGVSQKIDFKNFDKRKKYTFSIMKSLDQLNNLKNGPSSI